MCHEKSLSNIVTSIQLLLQKFENPKSSQLVKFIQNETFVTQGQDKFFIIEDVLWDESFPRIFYGSGTFITSEAELK